MITDDEHDAAVLDRDLVDTGASADRTICTLSRGNENHVVQSMVAKGKLGHERKGAGDVTGTASGVGGEALVGSDELEPSSNP